MVVLCTRVLITAITAKLIGRSIAHGPHSRCLISSCSCLILVILALLVAHLELPRLEYPLLPDAVAHVDAQEVICQLVKLLDLLDVTSYDGLLLLEDTDIAVDLNIGELLIDKITKGSWYLILALVIKEDVEGPRVVVDLELCTHWFFNTAEDAAAEDDVVDWVTIVLTDVIWPRLGI